MEPPASSGSIALLYVTGVELQRSFYRENYGFTLDSGHQTFDLADLARELVEGD